MASNGLVSAESEQDYAGEQASEMFALFEQLDLFDSLLNLGESFPAQISPMAPTSGEVPTVWYLPMGGGGVTFDSGFQPTPDLPLRIQYGEYVFDGIALGPYKSLMSNMQVNDSMTVGQAQFIFSLPIWRNPTLPGLLQAYIGWEVPGFAGVEWRSSDESVFRVEPLHVAPVNDFFSYVTQENPVMTWIVATGVGEAYLELSISDYITLRQPIRVYPQGAAERNWVRVMTSFDYDYWFMNDPLVVYTTPDESVVVSISHRHMFEGMSEPHFWAFINNDSSIAMLYAPDLMNIGTERDGAREFVIEGVSPGRTFINLFITPGPLDWYGEPGFFDFHTIEIVVESGEDTPVLAEYLAIVPDSITLQTGNLTRLDAQIQPENVSSRALLWSSSDMDVVRVDATGGLQAVAPGTATITAQTTDGSDLEATTAVIVQEQLVQQILLSRWASTVNIGAQFTLTATALPATAANRELSVTVSDPSVISFENGMVTALQPGVATIIFTAMDGSGVTASIEITVREYILVQRIRLLSHAITVHVGDWIDLNVVDTTMAVAVLPTNAHNRVLDITVGDPTILSLEDGILTARSIGTTTITFAATDGSGATATATVTVQPIGIQETFLPWLANVAASVFSQIFLSGCSEGCASEGGGGGGGTQPTPTIDRIVNPDNGNTILWFNINIDDLNNRTRVISAVAANGNALNNVNWTPRGNNITLTGSGTNRTITATAPGVASVTAQLGNSTQIVYINVFTENNRPSTSLTIRQHSYNNIPFRRAPAQAPSGTFQRDRLFNNTRYQTIFNRPTSSISLTVRGTMSVGGQTWLLVRFPSNFTASRFNDGIDNRDFWVHYLGDLSSWRSFYNNNNDGSPSSEASTPAASAPRNDIIARWGARNSIPTRIYVRDLRGNQNSSIVAAMQHAVAELNRTNALGTSLTVIPFDGTPSAATAQIYFVGGTRAALRNHTGAGANRLLPHISAINSSGAVQVGRTANHQGVFRLSTNNQIREGRLYDIMPRGLNAMQGFIATDAANGTARNQEFLNNVALHELTHALGWWGHSNNRGDVMDRWNLYGGRVPQSLLLAERNHLRQVYGLNPATS